MSTCMVEAGLLAPLLAQTQVETWLLDTSHLVSYVAVALLLLSSGFGAPIPEDIPLLVGGWLCRQGQAHILVMLPLAWVFVLAGDCILYFLGRRYGPHVPRLPGLSRVLTEKRILSAEGFLESHGGKTLFVIRFLAMVRAAMWFAAGALKIPFWKFIAYDGAAALIFAPGYLLLGWFFAHQYEKIRDVTRAGQIALTLVILAVIATLVIWQVLRRKRRKAAAEQGKGQRHEGT